MHNFVMVGFVMSRLIITKSCLYNFDPLKPHFYVVKLGFTGYTLFFLFLLKNIDCGYSLEPPRRRIPTIYVLSRNMKNIGIFLSENFYFLVVKFSIYLNRRVFVMYKSRIEDVQKYPHSQIIAFQ